MAAYPFTTYVIYDDISSTPHDTTEREDDPLPAIKAAPEGVKRLSVSPVPHDAAEGDAEPESVHVAELIDPLAHQMLTLEVDLGYVPSSVTVRVTFEPADAEVTIFASDTPADSLLDYRWERTVGNDAGRPALQFGALAGTVHCAALPLHPLDSLKLTLETGLRVSRKLDMLRPWQVLRLYNYSAEEEQMLRQWIYDNEPCFPLVDEDGCTPLHHACMEPLKGNLQMVELLTTKFKEHLDINQRDHQHGRTALHWLVDVPQDEGHVPYERRCVLAEYLVRRCAVQIDARDQTGATAAHLAAASDLPGCRLLVLLLGAGCNLKIRNARGQTPLEEAELACASQCVSALLKHLHTAAGEPSMVRRLSHHKTGPLLISSRGEPPKREGRLLRQHEENVGGLLLSDQQLRQLFDQLDPKKAGWIAPAAFAKWYRHSRYGVQIRDAAVDGLGTLTTRTKGQLTFPEFCIQMLKLAQR